MPTYEYKCKKCNDEFEIFQSMMEEPLKICPKCSGEVMRLISGGGGVIFKGGGFYSTDKALTKTEKTGKDNSASPPACPSCPHAGSGSAPPCAAAS
ncbi:MAG: zinc ribbon domain-containing protein [Termitinemataceae bacterium]|nr:MAG: zinc ribbon domain-containing protein [Termitinemataceae bacterium]